MASGAGRKMGAKEKSGLEDSSINVHKRNPVYKQSIIRVYTLSIIWSSKGIGQINLCFIYHWVVQVQGLGFVQLI